MMYYGPSLTVEREEDAGHLTQRIRNLIGTVALDCDCRQRVNDALQRFATQERERPGFSHRLPKAVGTEPVRPQCDAGSRLDHPSGDLGLVSPERHRHDRQCLMDARQQRASIAALVDLLGELEDVTWQEGDRSVFAELAHIFDDIARMAAQGSAAMQMISRETAP